MIILQKVPISKSPYKRSVEELFAQGVVVLDKPSGPKSRAVVQKVKNILEVAHAGHVGTLDPMVTGVLAITLNKATKLTEVLSVSDKTYEGVMKLHGEVSDAKLKAAFGKFTGVIEQLPPKISAVKRQVRKREIYSFDILKREDNKVYFRVKCQHGTYIRKLCYDVGDYLGVGANMWRLRRIQSGAFTEKDIISLEELIKNYKKFLETTLRKVSPSARFLVPSAKLKESESYIRKIIRPIEDAVAHLGKVWIDNEVMNHLKNGSPVFAPGIIQLTSEIKKDSWVGIFNQENKLCAAGKAEMTSEQIKKAKKGLAIKTDIVLI